MQRCSETKGTHEMKVEREDWSHSTDTIGYIPVTRWHKARVQLAGSSIIECIGDAVVQLVRRWLSKASADRLAG